VLHRVVYGSLRPSSALDNSTDGIPRSGNARGGGVHRLHPRHRHGRRPWRARISRPFVPQADP